jgi:hypothetical protein
MGHQFKEFYTDKLLRFYFLFPKKGDNLITCALVSRRGQFLHWIVDHYFQWDV